MDIADDRTYGFTKEETKSIWVNNPQSKTLRTLMEKYPYAPFYITSKITEPFIEVRFDLYTKVITHRISMDGTDKIT